MSIDTNEEPEEQKKLADMDMVIRNIEALRASGQLKGLMITSILQGSGDKERGDYSVQTSVAIDPHYLSGVIQSTIKAWQEMGANIQVGNLEHQHPEVASSSTSKLN